MFISPSGGPFLVWTLAVQLVLCGVYATDNTDNCKLVYTSETERNFLKQLEPLTKKNFTVVDNKGNESYTYIFQVCGDAGGVSGAGVIQVDNKGKDKKPTVIGMYTATMVIGGSDWVMLIYKNGETYDGHCSQEARTAMIMISCNRKADTGTLVVVQENREKKQECFYLFELDSSAICPVIESKLSTGSILLIIGLCLLSVYLIGGFLYQRLIVGSKGMEQFPNYLFWLEVGNLSADGCDFVCRSQNREESPAYRRAATEPIDEQPEERDDHLLPM
ncbi:cation-dependent mannose-6-phosphate receptor [Anabas testudineus]|uniref:Cation-dependent mannose-6-phosphate receptor n=1 Tax=Anabas testudineus TaxID=64144 RepID=A0A7N6B380_ANATE|nr:cation-dependent mannose-6-phosphate receptor [Anabas testudineus]